MGEHPIKDRGFLRELGFQIYSMEPFRYSRAALPGPFVYDMFAATHTGQLVWADVMFLRDLASPDCEGQFGFEITPERIIKTACLMELFGLQDCAAELLQARADLLTYPINPLLDLLVPPYLGRQLSYRDYIAKFETDSVRAFSISSRNGLDAGSAAGDPLADDC